MLWWQYAAAVTFESCTLALRGRKGADLGMLPVTDALGDPLRFNRPQPTAFGLLCAAPGIHGAAQERLAPRAQEILGRG